jgi:hypothetical protein
MSVGRNHMDAILLALVTCFVCAGLVVAGIRFRDAHRRLEILRMARRRAALMRR